MQGRSADALSKSPGPTHGLAGRSPASATRARLLFRCRRHANVPAVPCAQVRRRDGIRRRNPVPRESAFPKLSISIAKRNKRSCSRLFKLREQGIDAAPRTDALQLAAVPTGGEQRGLKAKLHELRTKMAGTHHQPSIERVAGANHFPRSATVVLGVTQHAARRPLLTLVVKHTAGRFGTGEFWQISCSPTPRATIARHRSRNRSGSHPPRRA